MGSLRCLLDWQTSQSDCFVPGLRTPVAGLMYADDVVIMSESVEKKKKLVEILVIMATATHRDFPYLGTQLVPGRRSYPGRHGHCHSRRLPVPRHHWCKVCHAIVPVSATGRNVLSAQRHIYTCKNIQGPRLFRTSSAPPANSRSFISTTVIKCVPCRNSRVI